MTQFCPKQKYQVPYCFMRIASLFTMSSDIVILILASLQVVKSVATPSSLVSPRDAIGTATVSLAVPSGTPEHLASGFIYGLPDSADGSANFSIPDRLIRDMGFNYNRAGGAQISSLGWVAGQFEVSIIG